MLQDAMGVAIDMNKKIHFEKVLSTGRLLMRGVKSKPGSHRLGIKRLHNERYELRIDSDYRLVSTGTFFKKRTDDESKSDKIIRFEKLKNHARLSR